MVVLASHPLAKYLPPPPSKNGLVVAMMLLLYHTTPNLQTLHLDLVLTVAISIYCTMSFSLLIVFYHRFFYCTTPLDNPSSWIHSSRHPSIPHVFSAF